VVAVGKIDGAFGQIMTESLDSLLSETGDPHPATDVPEDSPALIM
jgi:hypothetical protein